uniref:PQQ-dependent sugar dehydrogenase n=1 Tax=Aquisphaera insulae TaxID=2712864 RepID=UPI0013E9CC8E
MTRRCDTASAPGLIAALAVLAALVPGEVRSQTAPARDVAGLARYRAAALAARGDAARGRRLFEDAARTQCATCHAIGGKGPSIGPDLSSLGGGQWDAPAILDSILEPSAKIHPEFLSTVVALKSGRVLQGLLRPTGEDELQIVTSATESIRLARSEIEEQSPSRVSLMPEGLHAALTPGQMADLVAYLGTLEPPASSSPREAVNARDIPRATRPVTFVPRPVPAPPLHRPVWFGPLPGHAGTSAVIEMQRGRVWLLEKDGRSRSLFVDVGGETTPGELTGLTSVAFHPEFPRNGRYFLERHSPRDGGRLAVEVVERRAAAGGLRDSGEPSRPILRMPVVSDIHNGGNLAFGPDGKLYIGMGDTGPQGDPRGHGQDLSTLLAKISRIDVDRADDGLAYAIPADNPFRNREGARPEIWALGCREPWRFSFDPPTGDLWVGDVGQGLYEEVSIVRRGDNHGWNVLEGFRPFSDRFARPGERYVPPVFAYHHRVGVSVTGGFVYRGGRSPALAGRYVFGDYETRRVWAIGQKDRTLTSIVEIGRAPERIASFGLDDEGELYVVGLDRGGIYRIDPTSADLTPILPAAAREVASTSRKEGVPWRRTERRPAADWAREDFDDTSWPEAPGGFGTRGTPGAVVRTEWRSRDIWMRREFTLPEGDRGGFTLSVHHDEDAEIHLNGVLAARLRGFISDY